MIRNATEADFAQILELSAIFWKETHYNEEFEADHNANYVKMAHDHGLLAVVEINSKVVGFTAGIKSFSLGSSKALTGTELAWFVLPKYRGGTSGIKLLKYIEQLARDQGIKYWAMISMESCNPEYANKLYERLGYARTETTYSKVLT